MAANGNQQSQLPGINDAHRYRLHTAHTAHTTPAAQALAERAGIELPQGMTRGIQYGMMYPIRRLVITGEDRPANFAALFGDTWEEEVGALWKQCRIEVLLCPPTGSASHTMGNFLDEGAQTWRPRPPSVEEEAKVREIEAMSEW